MTVTTRVDYEQMMRFFDALYQDGDWFHVLAYTEDWVPSNGYEDWVQDILETRGGKRLSIPTRLLRRPGDPTDSPRGFAYSRANTEPVCRALQFWNKMKFGIAASLGVFNPCRPRRRIECIGLSAFAIDIDPNKFTAIKPDAKTVEEIIPETIRLLRERGLSPHALVKSGRGLHVYFLIQRLVLTSEEDRDRATGVWWKLCQVLGRSTDRHDLASVLRVPGSIHWKGGDPKRVSFVEEHTDLGRARFVFEDVARAVEDIPAMHQPSKQPRARRSSRETDEELDLVCPDLSHDDQKLLAAAIRLDQKGRRTTAKGLEGLRAATRDPNTEIDHSDADFGYACRLLEVGLPANVVLAELFGGQAADRREDPRYYVYHTFRKALAKVWPTKQRGLTGSWKAVKNSWAAVGPYELKGTDVSLSSIGEVEAASSSLVNLVLARPGDGKTRDVVNFLSGLRGACTRTALLGAFIRSLLRHEWAINTNFPGGFEEYGSDGCLHVREDDLPETTEDLFARLPEGLWSTWTLDRLDRLVRDPTAFFINQFHPIELDERLELDEEDGYERGEEEDSRVDGYSDRSREQSLPAAVLKFQGKADLCIMGHAQSDLNSAHPPCSKGCAYLGCRANSSPGGAKTYWTEASFPLLTHKAYITQVIFNPMRNNFDSIIVDELPSFVYRYPIIWVKPGRDRRGERIWEVSPLDCLPPFFMDLLDNDASADKPKVSAKDRDRVNGLVQRIVRFSENLSGLAEERHTLVKSTARARKSVQKGDVDPSDEQGEPTGAVPCERMVQTWEPILSKDEFSFLLKVSTYATADEPEDDEEEAVDKSDVSAALTILRDFSDDENMEVFLAHTFKVSRKSQGKFWICRPVDGWDDLLKDHKGGARQVVLLDATAGIDPRYLLRGQFAEETVPDASFPNTIVVVMETTSKTNNKKKTNPAQSIIETMAQEVFPYRASIDAGGGLLVLTDKDMEAKLRPLIEAYARDGLLPKRTAVDHFGALRGRNDYDSFNAVYLTQPPYYEEAYYDGLGLLLHGFTGEKVFREWQSKNKWNKYESIRARAVVSDIYQDAMRIGIRRNPKMTAFIFVPTRKSVHVVRLMRLFKGAKVVLEDQVLRDSIPATDDQAGSGGAAVLVRRYKVRRIGRGMTWMPYEGPTDGIPPRTGASPSGERAGWGHPVYPEDLTEVDRAIRRIFLRCAEGHLKEVPGLKEVFDNKAAEIANAIPDEWKLAALEEVRQSCPAGVDAYEAAADRALARQYPETYCRRWQ